MPPEKTTPGMAVTAAASAGLQRMRSPHGTGGNLHGNFPGGKLEREQATACIRIQRLVSVGKPHVGVRDIDMVLIRGRAPHDPSQRPTLADPRVLEDFALLVRIPRVDDAGFL